MGLEWGPRRSPVGGGFEGMLIIGSLIDGGGLSREDTTAMAGHEGGGAPEAEVGRGSDKATNDKLELRYPVC